MMVNHGKKNGGFHSLIGVSQKRWMVFVGENPNLKLGWLLGVPLWLRKHPCGKTIHINHAPRILCGLRFRFWSDLLFVMVCHWVASLPTFELQCFHRGTSSHHPCSLDFPVYTIQLLGYPNWWFHLHVLPCSSLAYLAWWIFQPSMTGSAPNFPINFALFSQLEAPGSWSYTLWPLSCSGTWG